ncbi:MAG: PQQ-dependent sugar dehydrogenase [Rhizobiaceae bacterium]|nr:PQQ-dependent sugar dehydrogenase [Rhizobiaceae bacterium]
MSGNIFFGAAEYSVREGEPYATVVFKRSGDLSRPVTIEFETEAGTATSSLDYTPRSGTLVMPAGATSVNLTIPIINDGMSEPTERFSVSLISVDSGTVLFPRTTNVSILDDENPVPAAIEPPLTSHYAISTTAIVSNLVQPVAVAWLDGGLSTAFVAEKQGVIKYVDAQTGAQSVVLDIRNIVNSSGDRGLLNVVLHPDFQNNHYLYAFYVADPPETATATGAQGTDGNGNRFSYLVRYEVDMSGAKPTIAPGSGTILLGGAADSLSDISGSGTLNFTQPVNSGYTASDIDPVTGGYKKDFLKVDSQSHAGGGMAFGPDGKLYVAIGDGTSFSYADPRTHEVQDVDSLSGKVLRIDPITGMGLADNPFAEQGHLDSNQSKVWQLGLRNPYVLSFGDDGRLFISETGWSSWEEINTGGKGANFGWPYFEGGDGGVLLRSPQYDTMAGAAAFYDAVAARTISVTPAYRAFSHFKTDPGYQVGAIVGATDIYTGNRYPAVFANDYFFANVTNGQVFSVDVNDRTQTQYVIDLGDYGPVNFTQGPDGYMYMADLVNGHLLRLNINDVPNQAPVAVDDTWTVTAGSYAKIAGGYLTANDIDGNSDAITLRDVSSAGRTAGLLVDGTVTYKAQAAGSSQFDYTAIDGFGGSDTGTVKVTAIVTTEAADKVQVKTMSSFIDGRGGDDTLTGGSGHDVLNGGDGNDQIDGKSGPDIMSGGNGDDTIYVGTAGDVVVEWGPGGKDTVISSVDNTLAANVENLILTLLAAKGTGNKLDNSITGTVLANTLDGAAGNDTLIGGGGDDTLTGGAGKDLFVFDLTSGKDRITDFEDGRDRLDFRGSGLHFADLAITKVGADAIVDYGANELLISGLADRITDADFLF